ncbi:MAG: hypothetical protein U9O89_00175 [Thermoproteota archaeon]|nr:hypothetical protein [Thermoproteota archaeon]
MGKIKTRIKADFGEIVLEGDTTQEILDLLKQIPPDFLEKVNTLVSEKLTPPLQTKLEGIIEFTTEGPVVTTRKKLTHYEAIGLTLYGSEGKINTSTQIERLLESSGIKSMVPARLYEMTKRGLVFKPDPNKPEYRLTAQGERWIEEDVLPKLREPSS